MSTPGFTAENAISKPSATFYGRRTLWGDSPSGLIIASGCPYGQSLQCQEASTTTTSCACEPGPTSCKTGQTLCPTTGICMYPLECKFAHEGNQ
jgi:hypothetical protein